MEIDNLNEVKQPLLKRAKLSFSVSFDGPTPSRQNLRKALVDKLKADINKVQIEQIHTDYGLSRVEVKAIIYDDAEDAKLREHILKRHEVKKAEEKESGEKDDGKEEVQSK